jgi:transposase
MTLLDTIAGVARRSAQLLLAEVGTDMQRFPTAAHLCKWAGVCPGNHESGGRQYSGKTPPSNRWLHGMLVQMANAAVRCKTSYFACVYRRLAARRGHKRAMIAVAHRLGNCRLSYAAAASTLSRLSHHCSRTAHQTTIS